MSKTSIVLIIIAILVAAGLIYYYGYYNNNSEEANGQNQEEQVDLGQLFEGIQASTEANLVEVGDEELKWAVEENSTLNEVSIMLNSLRANSVLIRDGEDVKDYLSKEGFEPISVNLPLKRYAEINGYRKGNVVCLVLSGPTGYKEAPDDWTPPNPDYRDIDIRCGEMQSQEVSEVTCSFEGGSMTLSEAKSLAQESECGGDFASNHICNPQMGMWWLGLNIEEEGCNPTCEVNIETQEATLNMRCVNGSGGSL